MRQLDVAPYVKIMQSFMLMQGTWKRDWIGGCEIFGALFGQYWAVPKLFRFVPVFVWITILKLCGLILAWSLWLMTLNAFASTGNYLACSPVDTSTKRGWISLIQAMFGVIKTVSKGKSYYFKKDNRGNMFW